MHNILMSRSDYETLPAILAHEQAHVRCGHSWDLLFFGVLSILQWFNPLVWICQGELKLLHEYEADDAVLKQGIDGVQYQKLLIRKAIGETQFLQANGFNHAQLKLRIQQMRRPATPASRPSSAGATAAGWHHSAAGRQKSSDGYCRRRAIPTMDVS